MLTSFQQVIMKFLNFQSLIIFQFIIFILLLYKFVFRTIFRSKKNLPPSPPKLPIIGNLHQLGTHPYRTLRTLSEKYGELMVIHLGQVPTLIVSSENVAREIMKIHDSKFSSRTTNKTVSKLLYNGKNIGRAPYGEYWRQVKSICVLQLLSVKRVISFRTVREEEVVLLMEEIGSLSRSSSPLNYSDLIMTLTNDILCRTTFGRKYRFKEGEIDIKKVLDKSELMLGKFRVGDFVPFLAWIDKLNGWDAKCDEVANKLDQFFENVITEHQSRRKNGNHDGVKDMVDVLLDVQEGDMVGIPIERESIKGVILDMFTAGTTTTFSVLEWAMTELLRNYTVMEELKNEVRVITGKKTYVDEDDLQHMKYLKAVVKETLRLHPSVPLLVPRLSTEDVQINGYDIPSGTFVLNNAWAIQRNPASWENPEEFIPQRFLDSSTDYKGQDFGLIPFGAGRRICPGIAFAIVNIEYILANLVHKFDWKLPGGVKGESLDVQECTGFTAHRATPLVVIAVPSNAG